MGRQTDKHFRKTCIQMKQPGAYFPFLEFRFLLTVVQVLPDTMALQQGMWLGTIQQLEK